MDKASRKVVTWACGHTTSIAYRHWPSCPVCAHEASRFIVMSEELEDDLAREIEEQYKDGILHSWVVDC